MYNYETRSWDDSKELKDCHFYYNRAIIRGDTSYSVVDKNGETFPVKLPQYENFAEEVLFLEYNIHPFVEGLAMIASRTLPYAYMDINGKIVISNILEGHYFFNGCAIVKKLKSGYEIPKNLLENYPYGLTFSEFRDKMYTTLIDTKGNEIIHDERISEIENFGKNFRVTLEYGDVFFINKFGKRISKVYTRSEGKYVYYIKNKKYILKNNGSINWVKTIQINHNFDLYTYIAVLLGIGAYARGEFSLFNIFILISTYIGGKIYERRRSK